MSQRLSSFFTSNPGLRELAHRARQLAAMQQAYREATPPTLARASRVIGFEQRTLVVGADNSAIAAKLRQLAPQILQQLQGDGVEVNGIRVKVQVNAPAAGHPRSAPELGEKDRLQIAEAAATMPDSPLKNALLRLINRQPPKPKPQPACAAAGAARPNARSGKTTRT